MAAATTNPRGESPRKEAVMAEFSTVVPGTLPAGTNTAFGRIVRSSLTAYEVEGGQWVPFHKVHGPHKPASPLVVVR